MASKKLSSQEAAYIKNPDYDPSKFTVLQTLEMYANETRTASTSKVNPKSKSQIVNEYLRGFRNIPEMKAILEMPLTDFFKFVEDPNNNVYKKFYDRVYKEAGGQEETIKKGTPLGEDGKPTSGKPVSFAEKDIEGFAGKVRGLRKYISVLQDIHTRNSQVAQLDQNEISKFNLRESIPPVASRAPGKADFFEFDFTKIGEVQLAIMEAVQEDPSKRNAGTAALLMSHLGFRVEEVAGLQIGNLTPQKPGSKASGIVDKGSKGTRMNTPQTSRVYAILQQHLKYLAKQGVDISNPNQFLFPNLKTQQITDLAKSINVEGIRELKDNPEIKFNSLQEADDFRNLHATLYKEIFGDYRVGAAAKGRKGSGAEAVYDSGKKGYYVGNLFHQMEEADALIMSQLAEAGGAIDQIDYNTQMIDYNSNLMEIALNSPSKQFQFKVIDRPKDGVIAVNKYANYPDRLPTQTTKIIDKTGEVDNPADTKESEKDHKKDKFNNLPSWMSSNNKLGTLFAIGSTGYLAENLYRDAQSTIQQILIDEGIEGVAKKTLMSGLKLGATKANVGAMATSMFLGPSNMADATMPEEQRVKGVPESFAKKMGFLEDVNEDLEAEGPPASMNVSADEMTYSFINQKRENENAGQ